MRKLAEYFFRCGKDSKAVSKELGVSLRQLYKIMGGKEAAEKAELLPCMTNCEMENALLKKARGYTYTEVKETEKDKGSEVTTVHKEALPDVSAVKAWLDGRSSDGWGANSNRPRAEEKLDMILNKLNEDMEK